MLLPEILKSRLRCSLIASSNCTVVTIKYLSLSFSVNEQKRFLIGNDWDRQPIAPVAADVSSSYCDQMNKIFQLLIF